MKEQLSQNLETMKAKFVKDLETIYQKALDNDSLSQALKAKEILAKCFFSNKSEKTSQILDTNGKMNPNNLKKLLQEIKDELKNN